MRNESKKGQFPNITFDLVHISSNKWTKCSEKARAIKWSPMSMLLSSMLLV